MKIPDKEKLFKELTDLITPEQEKEFFVLCELKKNPSFSTGGLKRNNNGYDDCAIFMKFSDEPISQFNIPEEKTKSAHESFETAKNYYENTLGVYRMFHLKDGIKTILEKPASTASYAEKSTITSPLGPSGVICLSPPNLLPIPAAITTNVVLFSILITFSSLLFA